MKINIMIKDREEVLDELISNVIRTAQSNPNLTVYVRDKTDADYVKEELGKVLHTPISIYETKKV